MHIYMNRTVSNSDIYKHNVELTDDHHLQNMRRILQLRTSMTMRISGGRGRTVRYITLIVNPVSGADSERKTHQECLGSTVALSAILVATNIEARRQDDGFIVERIA